MALYKEITLPMGVTVNYWKITHFSFDMFRKVGEITLTPYITVDKSRPDTLAPAKMATKVITVKDIIYDQEKYKDKESKDFTNYFSGACENMSQNFYKVMYDYIKNQIPDFKDAEDV